MKNSQEDNLKLFLISFLILFIELATIRWLNATVPIFAYFNNLILTTCFLGLGLGCITSEKRCNLFPFVPGVIVLMAVAILLLGHYSISINFEEDVMFASEKDNEAGILYVTSSAIVCLVLNVLIFIGLGQEMGRRLRAIGNPLKAYGVDILGSLFGVLGYVFVAWLETSPIVWFTIGLVLLLPFYVSWKWRIGGIVMILAALGLILQTYSGGMWSPYYRIDLHEYTSKDGENVGFSIDVDNLRLQNAINFDANVRETVLGNWIISYELVYKLIQPKSVLILGAGAGNEAVVALQQGAEEVTAVEIDPVVAHLGEAIHPQRPYSEDNVNVVVDDARSFLSSNHQKYDLIVMSALDSHRQINGMSSIRLESFVYTKECYEAIKQRLNPGGIFCMNLSSTRPWMGDRTYWTLDAAFGKEPIVLQAERTPYNSVSYINVPESSYSPEFLAKLEGIKRIPMETSREDVVIATDDWPYLYLNTNQIPPFYIICFGALALVSFLLLFVAERDIMKPNIHFFALGAGFMLLETRSISQLALLFGTTWYVNAVAIGSILTAVYVVNAFVIRELKPPLWLSYILLITTLVAGYFFPFNSLLGLDQAIRLLVTALVIGLPIVWASFIFSTSFANISNIGKAFGSNLLGIVVGGSLEYGSNMWGMNSHYLLAIVVYCISWIFVRKKN